MARAGVSSTVGPRVETTAGLAGLPHGAGCPILTILAVAQSILWGLVSEYTGEQQPFGWI